MQTVPLKTRPDYSNALSVFARDIKLTHSIFALPFVGVAMVVSEFASVSLQQLILIFLCMVSARSFAMGMNRYLDRNIDSQNSRTQNRAIPSGEVTPQIYLAVTLCMGAAFVGLSFLLSFLAGMLSPVLLLVLMAYSYMKRLTWMTHWYLGICLGLAPIATEIALFDRVTLPIVLIGCAVAFWTAGFDLLYSLQDKQFDQKNGLHSVPAKMGHRAAIWMSRASFAMMLVFLWSAGFLLGVGFWWNCGVGLVGMILAVEHWIIREAMVEGTSRKINVAFFNLNALVSVAFFVFVLVDHYVRS